MQATITYLLTEQAQRAQMAATGQPVARKQTITVEISAEDLDILDVTPDGSIYLDLATGPADGSNTALNNMPTMARKWRAQVMGGEFLSTEMPEFSVPPTPSYLRGEDQAYWEQYRQRISAHEAEILKRDITDETELRKLIQSNSIAGPARSSQIYATDHLLSLLTPAIITERQRQIKDKQMKAMAEQQENSARKSAAIDAFLADPGARVQSPKWKDSEIKIGGITIFSDSPRYAELSAAVIARNDADAEIAEARREAAETAKTNFIGAWIAENADGETLEQFADGLLCRKAAMTLIADAAFAAAGVPEPAKYNDSFCDSSSCPCGEKDLDCLPRAIYPAWKKLKATLPEGYEVEFSRVRECLKDPDGYAGSDSETAGEPIYLSKIKLPHGPFVFERTVILG